MFRWLSIYTSWVERGAGWVLAALAGITLLLVLQLPSLQIHNDLQSFYPDDPVTRTYRTISETFGADRFPRAIYVRFAPRTDGGVTSPQAILEMEAVLNALRGVPGVHAAKGLPDLVKMISSGLHGGDPAYALLPVDGDPLGYSFAQVIQLTVQRLSSVQEYLAPQGTALVLAQVEDEADILKVAARVEIALAPLMASAQATRVELMSYGASIRTFNAATAQDLRLLLPLVAALMALILGWTFRLKKTAWLTLLLLIATIAFISWPVAAGAWRWGLGGLLAVVVALSLRQLREVYLPLAVVGIAMLWTFGLMALSGVTLSFLMIAVFPLLFGVGLDDALHLLMRFRQEAQSGKDRREAFRNAMLHTGRTLWYTTLTTMAGFGALIFSTSPPVRAFGLLATFAMLSAFVVTLTLIPAVQQLFDGSEQESVRITDRPFLALKILTQPRSAWIWLLLVGVFGIFAYANGQNLKVFPYDVRWLLPAQNDQVRLYGQINEEFKNYDQVQILIRGDVARLAVMRALNQTLTPALRSSPHVRQVRHIGRLLDDVRFSDAQAETQFMKDFQSDPDRAYQNLLEKAGQHPALQSRLRALIHHDDTLFYDQTVVRVDVLRAHEPEAVSSITADLTQRLERVRPELEALGLEISLSGSPFLEALSLKALKEGFFQSIGLAFILVGAVLILLFRSLIWGLVCLLPMALVMALELATIHWLGLRISASTALVAALGIGLGVDYTIHLAQRVRETGEIVAASVAVSRTLLAASGTTLAAFLTLMLGQIPWNRDFGILAGTAVAYALIVTLWVFPALLTVAKPWLFRSQMEAL